MWKVGGIKIESAAGRRFFYQSEMKIREKWKFFVNRSVPEHFQWVIFSGQVPTESLRTQNSENIINLGDRASVLKLKRLKV